jgi:hypothetical protein
VVIPRVALVVLAAAVSGLTSVMVSDGMSVVLVVVVVVLMEEGDAVLLEVVVLGVLPVAVSAAVLAVLEVVL